MTPSPPRNVHTIGASGGYSGRTYAFQGVGCAGPGWSGGYSGWTSFEVDRCDGPGWSGG